jgi:cell division protein FtsI/penicillin-binding protein 2
MPKIRNTCAWKTGTAQNELSIMSKGQEHACLSGFSRREPKIAVAVVLGVRRVQQGKEQSFRLPGSKGDWLQKQRCFKYFK